MKSRNKKRHETGIWSFSLVRGRISKSWDIIGLSLTKKVKYDKKQNERQSYNSVMAEYWEFKLNDNGFFS